MPYLTYLLWQSLDMNSIGVVGSKSYHAFCIWVRRDRLIFSLPFYIRHPQSSLDSSYHTGRQGGTEDVHTNNK